MQRCCIAAACLLAAAPAPGDTFAIGLPVACDLGTDCHIQQYVDRDPGPGELDFACGTLTYDGHKGTDFRVPTLADMARGVAVTAVADGVVRGVRDGMPDIAAGQPDAPDVSGRECGNGVVVDHGGGWETQYCHLRRGSVAVSAGDRVAEGQTLGLIGLSGLAQFPHVHLSVRHEGRVVDPFAPLATAGCEASGAGMPLWKEPVAYRPTGLLGTGFAERVPDYDTVKAGHAGLASLAPDTPALVLWAHYFGPREGDVIEFEIDGPGGVRFSDRFVVTRDQAEAMRAAGLRRPGSGWAPGVYRGSVTYRREGLDPQARRIEIGLDR